ncbi:MAG: 23S rRNA (adenine(2030)-N(6))-methyltransferase RlmJ [Alphaproteobacteria bacterium]|nr:23S rRNA (adenine(2030)-N(6))-methyltransferase RlmJ [Alphaproteobacteria bacterium]
MNYRHIYHAGNRCDVVKHAVLTLVLRHLRAKDSGFAVLDTHAGMGFYDLCDPRALKTGEAAEGVRSLLADSSSALWPQLADYYEVLRRMNPLWDGATADTFRVYPGSPLFAFHMLRPQDRLIACELHPEDFDALRLQAPADKRMQIHRRDGFEALGAFLPPPEKRGLALIDPPYEQDGEFDRIVKRVGEAWRRWPTGIYMIWYPVKDRPAIWKFHEAWAASGIGKILCVEFVYDEEIGTGRLNGSGLMLINPPWKLDEEIEALLPILHRAMGTGHVGGAVRWMGNSDGRSGGARQ